MKHLDVIIAIFAMRTSIALHPGLSTIFKDEIYVRHICRNMKFANCKCRAVH